jgi:paraquat-inducible protein B
MDAVLRNPGLKASLDRLPATLATLDRTLSTVEREVGASSSEFKQTLVSVRASSDALRGTLANADAVLEDTHALLDPRGRTAVQAQRAVDDLAATAARLRNIAERIDRDPSVLVRGR